MPESINEYDYHLPAELIAQHPLPDRAEARLMVVDRSSGTISHRHVADLPELLRAEDALVVNDTRVVPAKLTGCREKTGGRWDGLFLDANSQGHWRVLSKTRGKLQSGERVVLHDNDGGDAIALVMLTKLEEGAWATKPVESFGDHLPVERPLDEIMKQVGRVPLPHYIRDGNMMAEDVSRYQTIYARHDGAVAAPTAGLHFTPDLMKTIVGMGVMVTTVTLHVGIGTFKPIQVEDIDTHNMHAEWCKLREEVVERLRDRRENGGRIVAVGTTSVRTLESAAQDGTLAPFQGETSIFIKPGHKFLATDAMMTNFHLPKSSLLVMVSAFAGKELIRRAYAEAIEKQYRFFSYGDAMLIL
jgi:S-adenosylmethionine:tRNA ribosyltransferase-isomerase